MHRPRGQCGVHCFTQLWRPGVDSPLTGLLARLVALDVDAVVFQVGRDVDA